MTEPRNDGLVYTIHQVAERTGISPMTLRSWERRHQFPQPHRAGNAYREYSEADIAAIESLKAAREQGLSVPQAIGAVRSTPDRSNQDRPSMSIEDALMALEFDFADSALGRLALTMSTGDQVFRILAPLCDAVADRGHAGELSHAQVAVMRGWLFDRIRDRRLTVPVPVASPKVLVASLVDDGAYPWLLASGVVLSHLRVHVVACDTPIDLIALRALVAELPVAGIVVGGQSDGYRLALPALRKAIDLPICAWNADVITDVVSLSPSTAIDRLIPFVDGLGQDQSP